MHTVHPQIKTQTSHLSYSEGNYNTVKLTINSEIIVQ